MSAGDISEGPVYGLGVDQKSSACSGVMGGAWVEGP